MKVMRVGVPWARQAIRIIDQRTNRHQPRKKKKGRGFPSLVPKCRSEEVIFEQLMGESPDTDEEIQIRISHGPAIRAACSGTMRAWSRE